MTAATGYTVPTDPADPEHAALELIVRLPSEYLPRMRPVLQELTSLLHAAQAFAGMSWHDAKTVAGAIARDLALRPDKPAETLLCRAEQVRTATTAGIQFDDPTAVIRALLITARILDW